MTKVTAGDEIRLDRLAAHLGLSIQWEDPGFEQAVVASCLKSVRPIIEASKPVNGEGVTEVLAKHFRVRFEEVRGLSDVEQLEKKYLHGHKELGFARLREELKDPDVDALLFQRNKATEQDHDRWVAVLNLQRTEAKAYWDRNHELVHRIAEPPQKSLPFKRHGLERNNPLEKLIDQVAAEIAFYRPLFEPIVRREIQKGALSFTAVERIRQSYAPTASLLSVANAVVKLWPVPALVVTASFKGRKHSPETSKALRVALQAKNRKADSTGLLVYPNMRAPSSSPIYQAFATGASVDGQEDLSQWNTSSGKQLSSRRVITSAIVRGDLVYGLISDDEA